MGTRETHQMPHQPCLAAGAPSPHNGTPAHGGSSAFGCVRVEEAPRPSQSQGSRPRADERFRKDLWDPASPGADKTITVSSYLGALLGSVPSPECKVFFLCPPGVHTPGCKESFVCGWVSCFSFFSSSKCPPRMSPNALPTKGLLLGRDEQTAGRVPCRHSLA